MLVRAALISALMGLYGTKNGNDVLLQGVFKKSDWCLT